LWLSPGSDLKWQKLLVIEECHSSWRKRLMSEAVERRLGSESGRHLGWLRARRLA
jgi:hypothetical protein